MEEIQPIQNNTDTFDININVDETITLTTTSTVDKGDYLQKLQDNLDANNESIKNLQILIDGLVQANADIQSQIDTVNTSSMNIGKASIG